MLQQELEPDCVTDAGAHRPAPGPQDHRRRGPARLQAHHGAGLRDPLEQPHLLAPGLRAARRAARREEGRRPGLLQVRGTATTCARTTSATWRSRAPSTSAASWPRSSRSTAGSCSCAPCESTTLQPLTSSSPRPAARAPPRSSACSRPTASARSSSTASTCAPTPSGASSATASSRSRPARSPRLHPARWWRSSRREQPDVLFVQSSLEVGSIARHRDVFEELGAHARRDAARPSSACNDKAADARRLPRHDRSSSRGC